MKGINTAAIRIYRKSRLLQIMLVLVLGACTSGQPVSYRESILDRPKPSTEAERARECEFLRSEIARHSAIGQEAQNGNFLPETALTIEKTIEGNIQALKLRAVDISCPA